MRKFLALAALYGLAALLALTWRSVVPISQLWSGDAELREQAEIVFSLRFVRLLAGTFIGASLAASGAALQATFRNALAEPYLLGISAGGALGATLATALELPSLGDFSPTVFLAFGGALLAASVVYQLGQPRISGWGASPDRANLLLCGIALSAFLSALMALVITLSPKPGLAQQATFWLLGGLTRADWPEIRILAVCFGAGLALVMFNARDVDALQTGDEGAGSLGVNVPRLHRRLILAASLMSAACVAAAGLIGFVGLLAPHLIRLSFGTSARRLFPAAALGGATLLVGCDALAHSAIDQIEIPVGIITSLLGVPLFLYLMRKS